MLPHETLRGEKKADLAGAALSIFRSAAGLWSGRTNTETKVWFSKMDMDAMTDFQEVQNSQLGDALQKQSTFSEDEMNAFGIDISFWWQEHDKDIKYGIRVGEDVWQMHVGDFATDQGIAPPTAKRLRAREQRLEEGIVQDSKTLPGTSPNRSLFAFASPEEAGVDLNPARDIEEIGNQCQKIYDNIHNVIEELKHDEYSPPAAGGAKVMIRPFPVQPNDKPDSPPSDTTYIDSAKKTEVLHTMKAKDSADSPASDTSYTDSEPEPENVKDVELPKQIKTEDNQDTIPPGMKDKNNKPASTESPAATNARLKDIVTRAIHDGVAGALRDLNPEPSPSVEIPAPEPTELVLGHDYDFLASIAQSARFGKRVTPADVLCAGMAANLTVATARQLTFDYRRRFNAPAPNAEAMAMEDLSGYTREVLLAFRLLDVCLKPQWTRVGTQKRIELEFYSAVKDTVEATMSRR